MNKALFYTIIGCVAALMGHVVVPHLITTVRPWYRLSPKEDHYGMGPMDVVEVCVLVVAQLMVRYTLWDPLVRTAAVGFGLRDRARQDKFVSYMWTALCYTVLFQVGVHVTYRHEWWPYSLDNIPLLVRGYSMHPLPGDLKHYYLAQISYYVALTYMLFRSKRNSGHAMMLTHHLVTFTLISASYVIGGHRWGTATLLYFDAADIFLEVARTLEKVGLAALADTVFVVFIVVWIVTRHFYFPYLLITNYATGYAEYILSFSQSTVVVWYTLYGLSWLIEVFSVVWLWQILGFALAKARGENPQDPDSDPVVESEAVSSSITSPQAHSKGARGRRSVKKVKKTQ